MLSYWVKTRTELLVDQTVYAGSPPLKWYSAWFVGDRWPRSGEKGTVLTRHWTTFTFPAAIHFG